MNEGGIGKSNGFLVGAIAVAMLATSVLNAQPTLPLSLVVTNSDAVPGFAGESWTASTNAFQNPSIDSNNNVAFNADIADSGTISSANDVGYWYGAAGTLSNQIQEGGPLLPGTTGTTFVTRQTNNVAISPNGHMWIGGSISGGTVTSSSDQAIWTGQAGSFQTLVQEGDSLPGIGGMSQNPASSSSSNNRVNNAGQTIVSGTMVGVGAPPSPTNSGIWVGAPGSLGLVVQRNVPNAVFPGGELINTLGVSGLNGSGTVQISGALDPNTAPATGADAGYIVNGDGTGALSLVARTNMPSGIPGIDYGAASVHPIFGITSSLITARQPLNNGGRNIYGGVSLQGAAITTGVNDQALFTHSAGTTDVVAQTGDAAPGVGGDATLTNLASGFGNAYLNNNDEVAWLGTMSGTDITSANDVALWQTTIGGSDTLVVREGDAVPGLADTFFGAPTNVIMNNLGQIVFSSTLTGGTVTTTDNFSVWMWDATEGFLLAAREGSSYFGFTAGNPSYDGSGNGEGGSHALNDLGCLAMKLPGTSGEVAIVTTCIPEPTTGLFFVVGSVMALIRRRR